MKTMAIQRERMVWLDWMKVLAILSIIWGHFFSAGYEYLYVFSVQTFCVISGFLYKKSADWKTCIRNPSDAATVSALPTKKRKRCGPPSPREKSVPVRWRPTEQIWKRSSRTTWAA